ncbi:MAG: YraN family protein [Acidobacteria bacterium]|nr:MAG: YraN family protein [Acidobacteriota bacterium]
MEGERQARAHLENQGYRILDTRWRCRLGEIDLIARDGETTVFVEVRTRSSRRWGQPEETVHALKRFRLARIARAWLAARGSDRTAPCRFDVIAISPDPHSGRNDLVHLKDAFRLA